MKRLILIVFSLLLTTNVFNQTIDDLNNYNEPPSRLRGVIEKFAEDAGSLDRFYTARESQNRAARFRTLYADWLAFLSRQNFDALNADEKIDYLLFKNYLAHELKELDRRTAQFEETAALLPFAKRSAISKIRAAVWKRSTPQRPPRF